MQITFPKEEDPNAYTENNQAFDHNRSGILYIYRTSTLKVKGHACVTREDHQIECAYVYPVQQPPIKAVQGYSISTLDAKK